MKRGQGIEKRFAMAFAVLSMVFHVTANVGHAATKPDEKIPGVWLESEEGERTEKNALKGYNHSDDTSEEKFKTKVDELVNAAGDLQLPKIEAYGKEFHDNRKGFLKLVEVAGASLKRLQEKHPDDFEAKQTQFIASLIKSIKPSPERDALKAILESLLKRPIVSKLGKKDLLKAFLKPRSDAKLREQLEALGLVLEDEAKPEVTPSPTATETPVAPPVAPPPRPVPTPKQELGEKRPDDMNVFFAAFQQCRQLYDAGVSTVDKVKELYNTAVAAQDKKKLLDSTQLAQNKPQRKNPFLENKDDNNKSQQPHMPQPPQQNSQPSSPSASTPPMMAAKKDQGDDENDPMQMAQRLAQQKQQQEQEQQAMDNASRKDGKLQMASRKSDEAGRNAVRAAKSAKVLRNDIASVRSKGTRVGKDLSTLDAQTKSNVKLEQITKITPAVGATPDLALLALAKQKNAIDATRGSIATKIRNLDLNWTNLKEENDDLEEKRDTLKSQLGTATADVEKAEALRKQRDALEQSIAEAEGDSEAAGFMQNLESSKQKLAELDQQLASVENELSDAGAQQIRAEITALTTQIDKNNKSLKTLEARKTELEEVNQAAVNKIQEIDDSMVQQNTLRLTQQAQLRGGVPGQGGRIIPGNGVGTRTAPRAAVRR